MGNEAIRNGRGLRRAASVAALLAICGSTAFAADSSKATDATPAKKPAPVSKAAAATPSKAKPATATPAAKKKTPAAVDCKAPANFVEPVCAPGAQATDAQKFNTMEDIYSPPAKND